jgi:precorrin-6B methylase 2
MCKKYCFILMLAILFGLCSCTPIPRVKTEPDVVFVPTSHRVVREMLKLAHVKQNDVVYDLGSGDGRIVIAAARDFGARAVGIELDEKLVAESMENAKKEHVDQLTTFRKEDIFKADIHEATVVTLFLLTGVNQMLIPKLYSELQPGTRIVSHRFDMSEWKPDAVLYGYSSNVYFWYIPTQVEGDWDITVGRGEKPWRFLWRFNQAFQVIRATDAKNRATFKDIKLYGKDIEMTVEDDDAAFGAVFQFEGKVNGDSMAGTVTLKGSQLAGEYTWKGVRVKK